MATEFEYGLQEGLTSVGFVVGSLFMAKYTDRLREGQWIVIGMLGMGVLGILYGLATSILVAIIIVTLSGFLNAPPAIARRLILQRNSPREMRGRVFSTFGVLRDVIFLIGMFAAGLADYVDIRLLVIISGVILVGTGIWTQFLPGLGEPAAEWRQAAQRLRTATAGAALGAVRSWRTTSASWSASSRRSACSATTSAGCCSPRPGSATSRPARWSSPPATRAMPHTRSCPVGPLRARRSRVASTARCRRCSRATCSARSPR